MARERREKHSSGKSEERSSHSNITVNQYLLPYLSAGLTHGSGERGTVTQKDKTILGLLINGNWGLS